MKHRLRHPIRAIEEPFGKAGLIVAILALVLATTGAAFAAAGLNSKQKKEVVKIAKKYAGKPGANGAAGSPGKDGTNGTNGTNGSPGAPGESVTNTAVPTSSATCAHRGGAEFKVGSGAATTACNGEPGVLHPGETLAPGATETGAWSLGPTNETLAPELFPGHHFLVVTVASFAIPLAAKSCELPSEEFVELGLCSSEVHYVRQGETAPQACEGGTAEIPTAEPGNLCIYGGFEEPARVTPAGNFAPSNNFGVQGASTSGAAELFEIQSANTTVANGTWAVTESE